MAHGIRRMEEIGYTPFGKRIYKYADYVTRNRPPEEARRILKQYYENRTAKEWIPEGKYVRQKTMQTI